MPPPTVPEQSCDNCVFMKKETSECRRYPPVANVVVGSTGVPTPIVMTLPVVKPAGWCGEWKKG